MSKLPNWEDHFVCPGNVTLKLPKGTYQFTIERGPEYVRRMGHFTIQDFSDDQKTVDLRRAIDMAAAGWWSSDLQVRRKLTDLELLMQAEDLHVVLVDGQSENGFTAGRPTPGEDPGVIAFDDQRFAGLWCQQIDDDFARVLVAPTSREPIAPKKTLLGIGEILRKAHETNENLWVDVALPAARDLPVLLVHDEVDSIQVAFSGLEREASRHSKQERPSPRELGRGSEAVGLWTHTVYYHALNCGLRLPPTASSASGISPNSLGYNRIYVFVGEDFSYEAWWQGLRAGQVMVTNGPLIQPFVAGRRPGAVFQSDEEPLTLDISLNLATGDPIEYLEVIKNGAIVQIVRVADWAKTGELPPIEFKSSGWFLIRAVANLQETYRFGMTAPYYVEIGSQPRRISRGSAEFFLEWVDAEIERYAKARRKNAQRGKRLQAAREYWGNLVETANAP